MSEPVPPGAQPPPEQPYQIPGTVPAWSAWTLPNHPLRSFDVPALLAKRIG